MHEVGTGSTILTFPEQDSLLNTVSQEVALDDVGHVAIAEPRLTMAHLFDHGRALPIYARGVNLIWLLLVEATCGFHHFALDGELLVEGSLAEDDALVFNVGQLLELEDV